MVDRFKKMRDRNATELAETIAEAREECKRIVDPTGRPLDFWKICAGVDAYFHERAQKERQEAISGRPPAPK